ncbi:3986_t:CDS:2, partial [Funneliformis mosseae]
MVSCSILNLFNIQTRSTQIAPLDQKIDRTLTFFCNGHATTNASTKTVAYGQWHNIHDTNPLNYEFVIYKNGVMHKDLSVNIQRDLVIKKNEAKLLTTFDELDLNGPQSIVGGCVYISVR